MYALRQWGVKTASIFSLQQLRTFLIVALPRQIVMPGMIFLGVSSVTIAFATSPTATHFLTITARLFSLMYESDRNKQFYAKVHLPTMSE